MRGTAEIPGTKYELVYDMNALCAIEEANDGKDLNTILSSLKGGASLSTFRTLIWAGLRRDKFSLEAAGDLIGEVGLEVVLVAMEKALSSALPQEDGSAATPKKRRGAGTS